MKNRNRKNVLAEGEVTGHTHRAEGAGVRVVETDSGKELRAPFGAKILHEEHGSQVLPDGVYEVKKVQEFDHAEQESRDVVD